MKMTKAKRKRSKFFTIMLIPESSAKVRKLHVPYWAASILVVPLICIAIIVMLFQMRMDDLEGLLDYSAERLSETISENDRLIESLSDAVVSHERSRLENELTVMQIGDYEKIITEYEQRFADQDQALAELFDRVEMVYNMRHGIINVFNDLASLDIPFQFNENTLTDGITHAMGGAYDWAYDGAYDVVSDDELAEILAELDSVLSVEMQNMQKLTEIAEELESYFRARPTGWPVEGRVGSEFGRRRNELAFRGWEMHNGIDIGIPRRTEIRATAYGVVTYAGYNTGGYGVLVIIEHGYGYSTYYAHNTRALVTVGEEVSRGQVVALSGNTGRSSTPHLHYEVRLNNRPQNPRGFLG